MATPEQDSRIASKQSPKRKRGPDQNRKSKSKSPSGRPAETIILDDDDEYLSPNLQHTRLRPVQEPGALIGTQSNPFEIDCSPSPPLTKHTEDLTAVFEGRDHESSSLVTSQYSDYDIKPNVAPANTPLTKPNDPAEPTLDQQQVDLVNLILNGHNVFYTGSAGCGKTTVLKAFVKRFREAGKCVKITAPTGRAACDIGGTTTWAFAGWTPDSHRQSIDELMAGAHRTHVWRRLSETDVLVIDEISMVENHHFERLNRVMQSARRNYDDAFGGVQLVVTGDFCQLPPVKPFQQCYICGEDTEEEITPDGIGYKCHQHGMYYDKDKWAFRSDAWEKCDFAHVNLTTIHRQSDPVFVGMLQKLRLGKPLNFEEKTCLLKHDSETTNAVRLFGTRAQVKHINDEAFNKLPSKARSYACRDHFRLNRTDTARSLKFPRVGTTGRLLELEKNHKYEPHTQLKKGMQVVLMNNLDISAGLVNGSQGIIQGFEPYDSSKMPKASQASRRGRGPGRDTDTSAGDQSNGPVIGGAHAEYRQHRIQEFIDQAEDKVWPIVAFFTTGQTRIFRTIYADCIVTEHGRIQLPETSFTLLSRTQIPLMAAWAITTHKSQGMTLNRVKVDLSATFEPGQAYVALSRARSLEGLEVESFPDSAQRPLNEEVAEFLREKFGIE